MQKKQTRSRNGAFFALLLVGALSAGAGSYLATRPQSAKVPDSLRRDTAPNVGDTTSVRSTNDPETHSIKILKPKYDDKGNLSYTTHEQAVVDDQNKYLEAINGFLKESGVVPEGAVADKATLKDRTLTILFTKPFDTTYGTDDERTVVNGICTAIGQFKEVSFVVFTIEGAPLETLGNLDLTGPQPVQ